MSRRGAFVDDGPDEPVVQPGDEPVCPRPEPVCPRPEVCPPDDDLALWAVHSTHDSGYDAFRRCHGWQWSYLAADVVGGVAVNGCVYRAGQDGADRDARRVSQLLAENLGETEQPPLGGDVRGDVGEESRPYREEMLTSTPWPWDRNTGSTARAAWT